MAFLFLKIFPIFLCFTGILCREATRNPLVIVNGDAGSQLQLKLDKPETVHYWCDKKSDWFTSWLSVEELLPALIDCLTDNMRLVFNASTKTYSNSPGVQSRVPYFGTTTGIEYLDPSTKYVGEYFGSFVKALVATGYIRGKSIRAAPYDFRNAPDLNGDYFTKLSQLIEETFEINGNIPIVLVCHSLGCPYSSMFLQRKSQEWKDKYLRAWLTISAPWGGSIKTLGLYASGYTLGIPHLLVNPLRLRAFQRSVKSSIYLLPSKEFWTPEHVFVQTATRNYTINDFESFFKDIKYPVAIEMQKTVPPIFNYSAPNVPMLCLHGSGVDTPVTYSYKSDNFPDGPPDRTFGDGDGTVTTNSLRGCSRWKQEKPLIVKDFDSCEHNGILRNGTFIDFVKDFLYNSTF